MKKLLLSIGALATVVAPVAAVVACSSDKDDSNKGPAKPAGAGSTTGTTDALAKAKANAIETIKKLPGLSDVNIASYSGTVTRATTNDAILTAVKDASSFSATKVAAKAKEAASEFKTENDKLATFAAGFQVAIKSAAESKTDAAAKTLAVSNANEYPFSIKLVRVLKTDYQKQPDYNDHGIAKTIKFTNGIVNLVEQPAGTEDTQVVIKFSDAGMPRRIAYIGSVDDFKDDAVVLNWNKGDWTDLLAYLDTISEKVK